MVEHPVYIGVVGGSSPSAATMLTLKTWLVQFRKIVTFDYLKKFFNIIFVFGIIEKLIYESRNPDTPWLTSDAVEFLKYWVKPTDVYLEFGSGQSTGWFLSRVKKTISIEDDPAWYRKIGQKNEKFGKKFNYVLAKSKKEYLDSVKNVPDNSVDICLVDGSYRVDCINKAIPKIKIGGILVLDNAETQLPVSWFSKSFQTHWKNRGQLNKTTTLAVSSILKKWRMVATSDVSQDTVIWVKR